MVCCPPSGYIIFSLRNFKFYEGRIWGPGAGGRITQRPHKISMWNTKNISNIDSLWIRIQVIPFNFLLNGLTFAFKARTCGNLYEGVHFTKTSLWAKLTSGPIHQHHQFLVKILRAVTQKKKVKRLSRAKFVVQALHLKISWKHHGKLHVIESLPIGKAIFYYWF